MLQLDTGNLDLTIPKVKLQMFPKEAFTAGKQSRYSLSVRLYLHVRLRPYVSSRMLTIRICTSDWMVAFRVVIPLYTVLALSQFVTYLLILIVGEKENKIREGMKIMGLIDSVFWYVVAECFRERQVPNP